MCLLTWNLGFIVFFYMRLKDEDVESKTCCLKFLTGCCRGWWSCDTCWHLLWCGILGLWLELHIQLSWKDLSGLLHWADLKNAKDTFHVLTVRVLVCQPDLSVSQWQLCKVLHYDHIMKRQISKPRSKPAQAVSQTESALCAALSDLLRWVSACADDAPSPAADGGFEPCSPQISRLSAFHPGVASGGGEHREASPPPCGLASDSWGWKSPTIEQSSPNCFPAQRFSNFFLQLLGCKKIVMNDLPMKLSFRIYVCCIINVTEKWYELTLLWSKNMHRPQFSLPAQNSFEGESCRDVLLQKNPQQHIYQKNWKIKSDTKAYKRELGSCL